MLRFDLEKDLTGINRVGIADTATATALKKQGLIEINQS